MLLKMMSTFLAFLFTVSLIFTSSVGSDSSSKQGARSLSCCGPMDPPPCPPFCS